MKWIAVVAAVIGLAVAGVFVIYPHPAAERKPETAIQETVTQKTAAQETATPDSASHALTSMRLPDIDGIEQPLSQWRGQVVVANFWATWCAPCRKEIPAFAAVSRHYADQPVQFVGISIDSLENVRRFNTEQAVPYPLLIGSTQTLEIATQLGNTARALPFTVILNRDGKVDHVQLGVLNENALERKIQALLK